MVTGFKKTIITLAVPVLLLLILNAIPVFAGSGATASNENRNEQDTAVSDSGKMVPEIKSFSELKGKNVSMLTGAPFEELVLSKAPDVGEFSFYNSVPDNILALKSGKTDAALNNNAIASLAVNRNPDLMLFPESLKDGVFGFAFQKGDPERDKWQEAYDRIPKEEINEAWEKWTGSDESIKILPTQDWPGKSGTVTVAACDTLEPMSYTGEGGEIKGFDIELILKMAKDLDYHVEFKGMEFSAILAYVQSGKALMGTGSIIVTDERREAVDFIEYYPAAFVLMVRATGEEEKTSSIINSLYESFEKNFIREYRWKLFIEGVVTTVIITLFSILFGTALGFMLLILCKDGNPAANKITDICLRLVQGMPVVVLLMILYYVVFGKVSINGIIVSIIGFTLVFGSSVYGLLKMGVGTVDKGQYEAAYALGYSSDPAFFNVILPQVLPHIMDAYKGEITGLIKATAIVGYIAVQDLTKVGDLVRSRTYEAFFPLIAVAVIYFLLEGLFGAAVECIRKATDLRGRDKESIIKGGIGNDKD